jgi:hypothetical protein
MNALARRVRDEGWKESQSYQAVTPTPIGHDTPVPPKPQ